MSDARMEGPTRRMTVDEPQEADAASGARQAPGGKGERDEPGKTATWRSRFLSGQWNETAASPASVLAGGIAYRLFLWLLPFGLILGGALGLNNTDSTEEAVARGGLPGAVANMVGDASRSAHSESWWLFLVGVPLLLWAGFSGAKAVQLIHALVWEEPPPKVKPLQGHLLHRRGVCVHGRRRIHVVGPRGLAGPPRARDHHRTARGTVALGFSPPSAPGRPLAALLPGALLVAIGFRCSTR